MQATQFIHVSWQMSRLCVTNVTFVRDNCRVRAWQLSRSFVTNVTRHQSKNKHFPGDCHRLHSPSLCREGSGWVCFLCREGLRQVFLWWVFCGGSFYEIFVAIQIIFRIFDPNKSNDIWKESFSHAFSPPLFCSAARRISTLSSAIPPSG